MQIIRAANAAWTKQVVCTGKGNNRDGCGALLLVSVGDLYYVDDSAGYYATFMCANCSKETSFLYYPRTGLPSKSEWSF